MTTMTATFDTLKFVRRLRDVGVEEKQAEAFAEVFKEAQDANFQDGVTKGDVALLKSDIRELKSDVRELETRIMAEINLLKWMLAVVVAATVLPALKSFFPH
ncbi:MAG: CCDC90 family protein [Magnetococcus sp. YQC-9]